MPGTLRAVAVPTRTLNQAAPVRARLGALRAGRGSTVDVKSLATPAGHDSRPASIVKRGEGSLLQMHNPDSRRWGLQDNSATLTANGKRPTDSGEKGT